jgi:hypothetical protein
MILLEGHGNMCVEFSLSTNFLLDFGTVQTKSHHVKTEILLKVALNTNNLIDYSYVLLILP